MSSDAARGRSPPPGVVPDLGRVAHVLRGAGEREHGIPFTSLGRCGQLRGRNRRRTSNRHRTRLGPSRVPRAQDVLPNALQNCSGRGCRSLFPAVPTRFTLSSGKACTKSSRGWCSCLSHKGEGTKGALVVAGPERPTPVVTARMGPDGRGRGARPSSGQLGSASRAGRSRRERIGDHNRINAASGMAAVSSHIVGRTPNSVPRPPARSAPSGRVP